MKEKHWKYIRYIAFSLSVIAAAASNLFIDKTQSQAAQTDVIELREEFLKEKERSRAEIQKLKLELANYEVINQRMNTFESQLNKYENYQQKANEKVDNILFYLLRDQ